MAVAKSEINLMPEEMILKKTPAERQKPGSHQGRDRSCGHHASDWRYDHEQYLF